MVEPDITGLLAQARAGDRGAENSLFDLVYASLWRKARSLLSNERYGAQLSSGTLIHEAFAKMFRGGGAPIDFQDRKHFYLVATRAMRQVIVERARKRLAAKRGGGQDISLDDDPLDERKSLSLEDLISISEACDRLAQSNPSHAQVVSLFFFAGFKIEEIAEVLGVSSTTVDTRLKLAKAFLRRELTRKQMVMGHAAGH